MVNIKLVNETVWNEANLASVLLKSVLELEWSEELDQKPESYEKRDELPFAFMSNVQPMQFVITLNKLHTTTICGHVTVGSKCGLSCCIVQGIHTVNQGQIFCSVVIVHFTTTQSRSIT